MNAVYGTYFKKTAGSCDRQVARLPRDVLVEISAIAASRSSGAGL